MQKQSFLFCRDSTWPPSDKGLLGVEEAQKETIPQGKITCLTNEFLVTLCSAPQSRVFITIQVVQGCHSSETKKFPDFSLTSKQFSLTLH